MAEEQGRPLELEYEPYELTRVYDAISNIEYPGSDSDEWTHKAKVAARELMEWARADERAKRPNREQMIADGINRTVDEGLGPHPLPDSYCHAVQCGVDAVLSSLALKPEGDQELLDRIEVLEKDLAYEVTQKVNLAEQLERAKRPNRARLIAAMDKCRTDWEDSRSLTGPDLSENLADAVFAVIADEPAASDEPSVEEVATSGKAILTDRQMFELVVKALLRGSFGWYSETFQQAHDAWFRWKAMHDDRVRSAERERLLDRVVTRAGIEAGARRLFVYDTAAAGDAEGAWDALLDDAPLRAIYRTRARAVLEAAARQPSDG
ncbi:hypothetical protein [Pseudoclavibacter sp. AY1H1]|uniref:hypothetical protein n=1 Tax=Pseudoclavibacter sp. AY1H1 TaxID=2080584 RepID=UPI000CE8B8CC|nr:hypothetical protein [Pseudoclavibacter sp. AY1H1]PPF32653.1 hypothetical protein C5E05_19300 [Pseudoclavibacter sp. AY1H1]